MQFLSSPIHGCDQTRPLHWELWLRVNHWTFREVPPWEFQMPPPIGNPGVIEGGQLSSLNLTPRCGQLWNRSMPTTIWMDRRPTEGTLRGLWTCRGLNPEKPQLSEQKENPPSHCCPPPSTCNQTSKRRSPEELYPAEDTEVMAGASPTSSSHTADLGNP